MKVLFATTNKAKLNRYSERLKDSGIQLVSLNDLNISVDVEETGTGAEENARIKAKAYYDIAGIPTFATDDSLYLENVPDEVQPGTHVKRVNGKVLNDNEMIEHYINLVKKYGTNGKLKGYFIKGIALVYDDKVLSTEVKTAREFSEKQSPIRTEGYPLTSIQFHKEYNKFKSELTKEESYEIGNKEIDGLTNFIIDNIKNIK